jgi:hypothetical protein
MTILLQQQLNNTKNKRWWWFYHNNNSITWRTKDDDDSTATTQLDVQDACIVYLFKELFVSLGRFQIPKQEKYKMLVLMTQIII